jgi:phage tail sheath protein FI
MPEYLAPGVYVEETSFRAKSIEGVSTTTTGFVGAARFGPIDIEPDIVTSVTEFERTYGDRERLSFAAGGSSDDVDNYLWHATRAFFEEGGKRLYVARVFRTVADENYVRPVYSKAGLQHSSGVFTDGHGRKSLTQPAGATGDPILITARFPGAAGNMLVRIVLRTTQNVLGLETDGITPRVTLLNNDLVVIHHAGAPNGEFYEAQRFMDVTRGRMWWRFVSRAGGTPLDLSQLQPNADPTATNVVRAVTATVIVVPPGRSSVEMVWDGLALHPKHERAGTPDSIFAKFSDAPNSRLEARTLPIVITAGGVADALGVLSTFQENERVFHSPLGDKKMRLEDALKVKPVANAPNIAANLRPTDADVTVDCLLEKGNDGQRPEADDYRGAEDDKTKRKTGLVAFEDIEDISIVAAPGSTYKLTDPSWQSEGSAAVNYLISHAQRMHYRIAVVDSGDAMAISEVRAMRGKIDSSYAALYYPWVRVMDPVTGTERNMPPSGFVAGIYARNDINRAVYKAPANEVVISAIGFETLLNKSQQDVLNPEGINCFRFFEGRGFRLWGARTVSSDPEWKYVNLRRYFAYLEHSIDRGTQWAVFEPNGDALWANVKRTVEDFLLNEWQMGALLGEKPERAFFVKCDRSTMSQNDLDNGRMVCLVGVAPLRPAEYVIFRIGQWTADRKV